MDPNGEEAEVFSEEEVLNPLKAEEEDESEEGEEEEEEEEDDEEEEVARIFSTWIQQYKGGEQQRTIGEEEEEEEEEGEADGRRTGSRNSLQPPARIRMDRRASLPCPATLSSMQLSRLHSSTRAPVTARVLLRRSSSSRRLLPSPQEAVAAPVPERRRSLIPTIPEAMAPERRGLFRRRNVMSMSDADSVCLICHNDLSQGTGGTRELQCTHTFHKECIEEWLWRKQSCPTCHVQVSVPQPVYWDSTRVKVP
ncbi:neurofilament medium polypeptide [Thunnus thynnus]|uniref:ATP-dependent RNA helicase DRS1 n=1 Tax=Thunnus maccoyii TaxID=8240 RepID=UPI001C4D07D1|nr:ATP-dependent RNA helicase DRS1 [Thunnus maccoyii]